MSYSSTNPLKTSSSAKLILLINSEFVLSWKKLVVIMRYCAFILWCDLRWRNKFYYIIGLSLIPVPYLNRAGGARKMSQIIIFSLSSTDRVWAMYCSYDGDGWTWPDLHNVWF